MTTTATQTLTAWLDANGYSYIPDPDDADMIQLTGSWITVPDYEATVFERAATIEPVSDGYPHLYEITDSSGSYLLAETVKDETSGAIYELGNGDNLAECVIRTLLDNDVPTQSDYTAAAGYDYGHVKAWQLADGVWAISAGNNAETWYSLDHDDEDLPAHLDNDDLSDAADILEHKANVFGGDGIDDIDEDYQGQCAILISRSYYGPTEASELLRDEAGEVVVFDSPADAQAWIDDEDDGTYVLSHNESGRPHYKIVEA